MFTGHKWSRIQRDYQSVSLSLGGTAYCNQVFMLQLPKTISKQHKCARSKHADSLPPKTPSNNIDMHINMTGTPQCNMAACAGRSTVEHLHVSQASEMKLHTTKLRCLDCSHHCWYKWNLATLREKLRDLRDADGCTNQRQSICWYKCD